MGEVLAMSVGRGRKRNARLLGGAVGLISIVVGRRLCAFHFVADSFESSGVVESEVGEDFAVDLDACFVDETHQLAVGKFFLTGSCVDTLNPEGAEVALFIFAVAVSVGETFFPSVLGNGPHIAAATEVTTGEF